MPPKKTTTPMSDAAIKALVARSVADALAEHEANRSRNGNDSHDSGSGGRRQVPTARECTYSDFLKCQPLNFKGTKGVVGLTQWFERTESVFHISNCTVENQVKFATCTLIGVALTWWNSHVKTVAHDAAYGMPWKTLMKMMTDKYCPRSEIKKLEIEIWNLKVKGTDVKVCAYAERQAENNKKFDNNNQAQQQPPKKQSEAIANTAGSGERNEYVGTLPLCNMCKLHHNGPCNVKCGNYKKVGNMTRDCRNPAAAKNQRAITCFECGNQGHYRSYYFASGALGAFRELRSLLNLSASLCRLLKPTKFWQIKGRSNAPGPLFRYDPIWGCYNEHTAGKSTIDSDIEDFIDCVNTIEVEDVCSSKMHFTWIKSPKNPTTSIMKKLDRIMVNEEFMAEYHHAYAIFHPFLVSDHPPAVIVLPLAMKKSWMEYSPWLFFAHGERKGYKGSFKIDINNDPYDAEKKNLVSQILDKHNEAVDDEVKLLYQMAKLIGSMKLGIAVDGEKVADEFVNHFKMFLGQESLVTDNEIKTAMFGINDNKAPGPNGYTAYFFKKAWDVVSFDVCRAVKEFFTNGKLLKEVNSTLIALIPKLSYACNVTEYRPIACCNVLYKCIKLLKGYNRKGGSKRYSLKIDIAKAYDTHKIQFSQNFKFYYGCKEISLTHLCFADDLLVMCHGDSASVKVIKDALDFFSNVSGLKPNKWFLVLKRPYHEQRRVQLIASFLRSMQVYWASVFLLTTSVVKEIERILKGFLWTQEYCSKKNTLWVQWIHLVKLKKKSFKRRFLGEVGVEKYWIWEALKLKMHERNLPNDLTRLVDLMVSKFQNRSIKSILCKIDFGAAVYFVWQERNKRQFTNEKRNGPELLESILEAIRFRLTSVKVMQSIQVDMAKYTWGFVFVNYSVVKEIERIFERFLWTSGIMARGKLKIAWNTICNLKYRQKNPNGNKARSHIVSEVGNGRENSVLTCNNNDRIVWKNNNGNRKKFSIKQVWEDSSEYTSISLEENWWFTMHTLHMFMIGSYSGRLQTHNQDGIME
ncbi:reverse transcriptase domain-containing protein [Tanacetum coccineum]